MDTTTRTGRNQTSAYFSLIKRHPLFHSQPDEVINKIIEIAEYKKYKKDEIIVKEHAIIDSFFFIIKGTAIVTRKNDNGEYDFVTTLTNENTIGLNATGLFSTHGLRTATVSAMTDMELLYVSLERFNNILKSLPHFKKFSHSLSKAIIKLDFIKENLPWLPMDTETLCNTIQYIQEIIVEPKTVVINQGDSANSAYLIYEGKIEIYKRDKQDEEERSLSILEAGEFFGEAAILSSTTRNASARTLTQCKLFVLSRELIIKLYKKSQIAAQALFGMMIKNVIPIRCPDIGVNWQTDKSGTQIALLHHKKNAMIFHLTKEGWFIWELIDNKNSVKDIAIKLFKETNVFVPDMVCNFLMQLNQLGYIYVPSITIETEFLPKRKESLLHKINKFFQFRLIFSSIDYIISAGYNKLAWIFFTSLGSTCLLLFLAFGFFAFLSFPYSLNLVHSSYHFLLLFLFLFIAGSITAVLHELAHAFATKHAGYNVQRMGIGWTVLGAFAFTDMSELWLEKKIKPHIIVDIAGIINDCCLAGAAALCAKYFISSEFSVFLWAYSLMMYYISYRNLSVLKEFDGYSLLSDLLQDPKLRYHSLHWLSKLFMLPRHSSWRDIFFNHKKVIIYWVVSFAYFIIYLFIVFKILNFLFSSFHITSILFVPTIFVNYFILSLISIYTIIEIKLNL